MKNKKNMSNTHLTEDFPKYLLTKRKELQQQLVEKRQKFKYTVLKYDKLIVQDNVHNKERRKRQLSLTKNT